MKLSTIRLVFALVALGSPLVHAANLVQNPGFENSSLLASHTFNDWNSTGDTRFSMVTQNAVYVHSGEWGAAFAGSSSGSPPTPLSTLSQDIPTTSGFTYEVEYWLRSDGFTPNHLRVSFAGVALVDQVSVPAFEYTHFTFQVTTTGSTSTLAFSAQDDPAFFGLDDVSVTVFATPEPTAAALFGLGLMGLVGVGKLRRRR